MQSIKRSLDIYLNNMYIIYQGKAVCSYTHNMHINTTNVKKIMSISVGNLNNFQKVIEETFH